MDFGMLLPAPNKVPSLCEGMLVSRTSIRSDGSRSRLVGSQCLSLLQDMSLAEARFWLIKYMPKLTRTVFEIKSSNFVKVRDMVSKLGKSHCGVVDNEAMHKLSLHESIAKETRVHLRQVNMWTQQDIMITE